jgi:hypothetical protein
VVNLISAARELAADCSADCAVCESTPHVLGCSLANFELRLAAYDALPKAGPSSCKARGNGFEAAVEWLGSWLEDAPGVRMAKSDIEELAEFVVDRLDEERHDTIAECVDFLRDRGNQFDSDAADTLADQFTSAGKP